MAQTSRPRRDRRAFTLIELLVSITILTIILGLTTTVISKTGTTWQRSKARVSQFRDARLAFELITRQISQATLNTYWDYELAPNPDDPAYPDVPVDYKRTSELQFVVTPTAPHFASVSDTDQYPGHSVFFQALLGYEDDPDLRDMESLLNPRGYYIEFGDDSAERPSFYNSLGLSTAPLRFRYRLMEYAPTSTNNRIYDVAAAGDTPNDEWYKDAALLAANSRPVTENIIALIISPRRSLVDPSDPTSPYPYAIAPDYSYDSLLDDNGGTGIDTIHTLPSMVQVTLVAIDEGSAKFLQLLNPTGIPTPPLVDPSWFKNVSNYDADLAKLEQRLLDNNLDYRVFSSTVALRAAKWSPPR